MNYAAPRNAHLQPWSRDLSDGDTITEAQRRTIDETRLGDFGLTLRPISDGNWRVRNMVREG